ncbi:MAG TPA: protein-L-isoaspartate O-methyltransferase [Anaeromyxobacteraceae bacterium]|nr:protein-L-isoaspartate O-methyltransferase [Anaeromyxobacteraceae bacterium]
MPGWIVPPPSEPRKSCEEFRLEREAKVRWLERQGLLRSARVRSALLAVGREDFIPPQYRDHAYEEVPLPLPGAHSTISCPHSYPLFYEPLGLDEGHRFLEIGTGSGYGAAVARQVVGSRGLVVSVEIDPVTHEFARRNLASAGYRDVVLVLGDGGLGHPPESPYDRIAVTAACDPVPPPLFEQLGPDGRLIAPVQAGAAQWLVLFQKREGRLVRRELCEVLYMGLRGAYGAPERHQR